MLRSTIATCLLLTGFAANVVAQDEATPAKTIDAVSQAATSLEAELGKHKDNAPEAGEALFKLTELYYENGRTFGLVRSAQRFVAAHPTDPRHAGVMLKLLDGLESLSRNKEFAVIARQFLTRYPSAAECPRVEERLAYILEKVGEREDAAKVYQARWRREPNANGRQFGEQACLLFAQVGTPGVAQGAELAEEMFDRLPKDDYVRFVGLRSYYEWRRISRWAEANAIGNKLVSSNLLRDPEQKREVLRTMAENYGYVGQHSNAVEMLKQVRALRDDQWSHYYHIQRLYDSAAPAAQMEPVVKEYFAKYPEREDRYERIALLAVAWNREQNPERARTMFRTLLSTAPLSQSVASYFVQLNGTEPEQLADTEKALLEAIAKNPKDVWFLRYQLGFTLYRDRLKDNAKAKQVLREMLEQSPTNDGNIWSVISWLLSNAESEDEFRADVARIVKVRREYIHWTNLRQYLGEWAKNAKRDKDLRERADYVQAELDKADRDPITALVLQIVRGPYDAKDARVRDQLLLPENFSKLNKELQRYVLWDHGYYYQHYSPGDERANAAPHYAQLVQMFPEEFEYRYRYLQVASDYGQAEVAKEAALSVMSVVPPANNSDIWRRLGIAADKMKDADLARQALAYAKDSQQKYGPDYGNMTGLGDVFQRLELLDEALAIWKEVSEQTVNYYENRESSWRLFQRLEDPQQKIAFAASRFAQDTDYHGRDAMWLADTQLRIGDLNGFEKTLKDTLTRARNRPYQGWGADAWSLHYMLNYFRTSNADYRLDKEKENTPESILRVARAIRDMEFDWPSAQAELILLESEAADARTPMERALAWQRVARPLPPDSHRWDQLMPFAQSAITRQEYGIAATLLTSMLENLNAANDPRKDQGRAMIGQCYTRLGTVGLTIDENSPLAPLLQAALYLRLGDESLALEAFLANKALFDQHRDEVPVDLLVFVCENLMAASGEENHNKVEDNLRSWLIKNSEATTVDDLLKAEIQYLLAKNFFGAKRYDVARGEYTTVINRYPSTPFATEAEFGIGETFMAQKVYDQAEVVFEKLANSRDAEIMIRAEFLRGVLAHRRGDNDEARNIFRNVLERVPSVELANQALYNLAEVYSDEERYMDQLQLLMTVGRLGRVSKRQHAPGMPLSIVVQDSDLGISRGHNRIPVIVRTEPGGDEEIIYLTSGGAGKGVFRADVDTELGPVTKSDKVLQLTGRDTIRCDYPEQFKSEFKTVPLSDVEIRIASDAQFEVASNKIIDEKEESFSERLERESRERQRADSRQSTRRPTNQIKPGNPIYLRVKDGDRDLGDTLDTIVAKLVADSGDQVRVELTETEPHSGVFEGIAKTGELPAGALASDTAIDHNPLMAIDQDRETYWQSEPDGATPKTLTVDMKDLRTISRAKFFVPQSDDNKPIRAELQASYDGEYWYRVAAHPAIPDAPPIAVDYGAMHYRLFAGNATGYTTWQQVLNLANGEPIEEGPVADSQLVWKRPENKDEQPQYLSMIWFGKFVQPRTGAVRFEVRGFRTALALNGRLELEPEQGNRSVDVWLEKGVHDLTIFAAAHPSTPELSALRARASLSEQRVTLSPFLTSDFDLASVVGRSSTPSTDAADSGTDGVQLRPPTNPLNLTADAAKFDKKTEQFGIQEQGENRQIANWQAVEDVAYWEFDAPVGVYDVWLNYSHQGGGSVVRVELGEQYFTSNLPNTGNWNTYRNDRFGTLVVDEPGQVRLAVRPEVIQNGYALGLRGVELRPASGSRVVLSADAWEYRFDPIDVRYTRFVINEYLGEAVAVNHVEISGEDRTNLFIPTAADVLALSQNDVLEIAGGDLVTASYTDEVTQVNAGGSRLLTGRLQATYFDAAIAPISYDFVRDRNGSVQTVRKLLKRVEPGERLVVEIVDYDRDQTAAPDQVQFEVMVNDGEPVRFAATETEEYSGIFTKEVDTTAQVEEDKLTVRRGDRIYVRYLDEQNTFPGHSVPRESVVYVNEPTDARIRILESRVLPPPPDSEAPPRITYHEPAPDAQISSVAFEAPLTVEVIDPDAARDSLSELTVTVTTSDGAKADVRCVVSGALSQVPRQTADEWALEEGRFIGQVILQLGSSTSTDVVPITSEMPRNLIGGGRLEEGEASSFDDNLVARVLNLTGKDQIIASYRDELRTDEKPINIPARGRLISNGLLACTDREYDKPISQLHVGEKLFLMVTDPDQDTSDERDVTQVEITTEFGEKETVQLSETLVHSGVFTGSFTLRSSEKPTPGNLQAGDPLIECYFGDTVRVRYFDPAASTESGDLELAQEIPVVIGTDGLVSAFSKTFNDEKLAVETKFHIAESYFELFKSHRELKRSAEELTDLAAGRRILQEVMEDYPDPKYVPRIAYLLGQFSQELENWSEAIESYEMIVRQYPDHSLAADAQYKLAQSHEEAGDFDEALEAYVTLAATYPKSPLIASVMIRISDHFYKATEYQIAAQVGEKFLERFEGHQHAARIAFRIGQCAYKAETFQDAGLSFDRFTKLFPEDELSPDALFWSGESFRMANNTREAFRRYNRCRWDFPESEAARYSRGRLALPEMLQQFEAEARSIEDQ
ncbi:MAG: tetratricopeptide repeat protein [Planctomycetota bacterium]|nr:tetratricopeptide repeat protein [Planctomycetota bacterium]